MKTTCYECAYWTRKTTDNYEKCYGKRCPAKKRDDDSDIMQKNKTIKGKMKTYKFSIQRPKPLMLESLAARAKVANTEDTGFYIEYVDRYPTLYNAQIRKEGKELYGLFFESNDMNATLLRAQLVQFLNTKMIFKVAEIK